jgi:D-serine deaminase-like pyridoxal phosphate-dependent protein
MRVERMLAAAAPCDTPLAVVDVSVMEANLEAMQSRVAALGWSLRPHAKTHKSATVARRQIAHGARGVTAATLREAESFATAGVDDILLAHPPVGPAKLQRLGALVARLRRLAVSVDSVEAVRGLPAGVEVFWEIDSGHHRLGTLPGEASVAGVVRLVDSIGAERFRGLLTFPGHAYAAGDDSALDAAAMAEKAALLGTAQDLGDRGISVRELSLGSTPTLAHHRPPGGAPDRTGASAAPAGTHQPTALRSTENTLVEARPGVYVYGDAQQIALGTMRRQECALAVIATVVSTPDRHRAVIDAGSKALAADVSVARLRGFGVVVGREHLVLERMSEEHGVLTAAEPTGLRIGDRVAVIPAHCCTTVNLHPAVLMVEEAGDWWDPVVARGWQPGA